MAYLNNTDLTKHDKLYIKELLKKICNQEIIQTKHGPMKIPFTNILQTLQKTLDINIIKTDKYHRIFNDLKWTEIDKSQLTNKSPGDFTRVQELCSLKVIEKANNSEDFDITKLQKIYPEMTPCWEESYKAQYEVFKIFVNGKDYKYFNRDGGFMDFITSKVKSLGISRKDTWNPADIWLLKNEFKSDFDLLYNLHISENLEELNEKMRFYFGTKEITGISLKKTSNVANYEINNLQNICKRYKITNFEIPFNFNNKTSYLKYQDDIRCCVRNNKSEWNNSLVYEFSQGNAKAQFGKVPIKMLSDLHNKYKIRDIPTWRDVPLDIMTFEQYRWEEYYIQLQILHSRKLITNIPSKEEFISTVINNIETIDSVKSSVLQSFLYFSSLGGLKQNEIEDYTSKICNLSQKKGPEFGPFIKIY